MWVPALARVGSPGLLRAGFGDLRGCFLQGGGAAPVITVSNIVSVGLGPCTVLNNSLSAVARGQSGPPLLVQLCSFIYIL